MIPLHIALAGVVIAWTGVAHAAPDRVVVRGFEYKEVDGYDKSGTLIGKVQASAFTFPMVSTEAGVAKSVGLSYRGGVVFVRRTQLKVEAICAPVEDKSSPSAVNAGLRASMGSGQNCLVDPNGR